MTYKARNTITLWTEKHEEFCLENKIPPAAQKLWQWLLRQGQPESEIEPDLTEFNTWIAKSRGKGYSPQYLKKMLDILIERRVINLVKDFCWKIKRILLRPLEWLKPRRKKSEKKLGNTNNSLETPTSNATNFDGGHNSSSNITTTEEEYLAQEYERQQEILVTCAEHGIYFNPEKQPEVLAHDIEDVKSAINHFHERGGHDLNNRGNKKIPNPQGWLIRCLQYRWWEDNKFGVQDFINSMIEFATRKAR